MAEKRIDEKGETSVVASSPTQELVLTVKTDTGEIVKVETLKKDGTRQELSDSEYTQLASYLTGGGMGMESYGADPYAVDPYAALDQVYAMGFSDAYYQGMADYEAAVAAAYGDQPSTEELAYYQGMADYAASLG